MRINKRTLVALQYRLLDSDGELIEETSAEQPFEFIYGMGMLLPAFEAELSGLERGDKFDFRLAPKDAYGELRDDLIVELERSVFHIDGAFDSSVVYEGARVPMNTVDGQTVVGLVTDIDEEKVTLDFNHDLAGEELHFMGEVTDVHRPSQEEYDSFFNSGCSGCGGGCGHHHGEGHGHCGCCGGQ